MTGNVSQDSFASALLDPDQPVPAGLTVWNGSDPARRFAVYRNNVVYSLVEALTRKFPVVLALVGEEFFRAMARQYCVDHPPRSPLMARYGDDFPTFIAAFLPAASVPYLADVARLEVARLQAYHAGDGAPLDVASLSRLAPDRLMAVTFRFLPSVRFIHSPFAIVSLWAAHQGHCAIGDVDPSAGECAVVARPELDVEVTALSQADLVFLQALDTGAALGDAALFAMEQAPDFDLGASLRILVSTRIVAKMAFIEGANDDDE